MKLLIWPRTKDYCQSCYRKNKWWADGEKELAYFDWTKNWMNYLNGQW